jgi:uncharacterized metal-binding protein
MIIAIVVLSALLAIVLVLLMGVLLHLGEIKQQIIDLDKMQHVQNKELIECFKFRNEATTMLLQHIDILKYLVEKDPAFKKSKWEA